ncbi:MAG: acylneuraminate cytidylyltransferase family protein [Magnetococcales bacterium]|nr:acylneuraminate cytidylyltransferase family protein [Magnetococcales bacterium]
MRKRICIIPARGGSKRLPDKNIRDFCGQPILGYGLQAARASGLFEVIHVSTDSPRIAEVATRFGCPPDFYRDEALSDDHTPLMPVLKHVLEQYIRRGIQFDSVCLLFATAPLVASNDLVEACRLFDELYHTGRTVMSVAPYPVPVEWAFTRREDGILDPVQPGKFAVRSQDLPICYYDTGSFSFIHSRFILENTGAGSDTNYIGYPLPRWKAVDIDDAETWEQAEWIFRAMQSLPQKEDCQNRG